MEDDPVLALNCAPPVAPPLARKRLLILLRIRRDFRLASPRRWL